MADTSEQQQQRQEEPQSPPATAKKEKKKREGLVIPDPKPKLTKAERRAIQEAQRAAKQQQHKGVGGAGAAGANPKPGGGGGGGFGSAGPKAGGTSRPNKASTAGTAMTATSATSSGANEQHNSTTSSPGAPTPSSISMVSHLQPPVDGLSIWNLFSVGGTALTAPGHPHLHPAVVRLGYEYATGQIRGGNARCRAMLECFCTVISDYAPPLQMTGAGSSGSSSSSAGRSPDAVSGTSRSIDLRAAIDQQVLKPSFAFWSGKCRPHSVSMGNAITFLKAAAVSASRDLSLEELKRELVDTIRAYQRERVDLAMAAIAESLLNAPLETATGDGSSITVAASKAYKSSSTATPTRLLRERDVILVYGYSEVTTLALTQAAALSSETSPRRQFFSRVIVADSHPLLEGRTTLRKLRRAGIKCSYVLLNSISYVMPDVTKVLLGASALLSDGSVLGRSGSAAVALAAQARRVPVLVCAETYKISNRVQLESLTMNELGCTGKVDRDKENVATNATSSGGGGNMDVREAAFKRLHLLYDLTPAQFVSGIVTELGIVPPTSVAVLLREMNPHDVTRK